MFHSHVGPLYHAAPSPEPDFLRHSVAVVVPCYNAGPRLMPVVTALQGLVGRIIVVDDGSTDGAVEALRSLPVEIVVFPENRGKGHAMLAGFRAALDSPKVSCVGIVDADGQHDPAELPQLYEAFCERQADLVIGSRDFDRENVPWRSRLGNKLTIAVTAWLLRQRVPDTQSGFRLHSRRLLEDVLSSVRGGRYETEMEILVLAIRKGYRVVPIPIRTIYEKDNRSSHFNKMRDSVRIYKTLLMNVWRTRSQ